MLSPSLIIRGSEPKLHHHHRCSVPARWYEECTLNRPPPSSMPQHHKEGADKSRRHRPNLHQVDKGTQQKRRLGQVEVRSKEIRIVEEAKSPSPCSEALAENHVDAFFLSTPSAPHPTHMDTQEPTQLHVKGHRKHATSYTPAISAMQWGSSVCPVFIFRPGLAVHLSQARGELCAPLLQVRGAVLAHTEICRDVLTSLLQIRDAH